MKNIIQTTIVLLLILPITIGLLSISANAQVAINADNSAPDASAMLDVKSTDKGVLIPRMSTAVREAIASGTPTESLLTYDSDTHSFWFYNGSTWAELGTAGILADTDGDTKIQLEESTNENIIRFDIKGEESLVIERSSDGNVSLDIKGDAAKANTLIGNNAGKQISNGTANVVVGKDAGKNINSGSENTIVGEQAGQSITSGGMNTFIGRFSGQANQTGTKNVFVGYNTGFSNTGSGNVFLGHNVGSMTTNLSNRLFIDNTNTSAPLIYGEFDNNFIRINGSTEVTGLLRAVALTDQDEDTRIELGYNSDDDIIRFDVAGTEVAQFTKNTNNDFILRPTTNTNVIFGQNTGTSNTGTDNTFIGNAAGQSNQVGLSNVFIGSEAGKANTDGFNNVCLGANAGISTSGSNNVYIGQNAANNNSSGNNNIMIGQNAGVGSSGSSNVFIGQSVGTNISASNRLYIDNESNSTPLIYGEFDNGLVRINGKLTTQGSLKIGSAGQAIEAIYTGSFSRNVSSISGNSSRIEDFVMNDARPGDVVYVTPRQQLPGQTVIAQAWVELNTSDNKYYVRVRFRNTDGGSNNPDDMFYDIAVVHFAD